MSPEAQRIAIGEVCRWPDYKYGHGWFLLPDDIAQRAKREGVSDYTGNFNAIHAAIGSLPIEQQWQVFTILANIVDANKPAFTGSCEEYAQAFLRVTEKWDDSK